MTGASLSLTGLNGNVGAAGPHSMCADGVRSAGKVLERDNNLLPYLRSDYRT